MNKFLHSTIIKAISAVSIAFIFFILNFFNAVFPETLTRIKVLEQNISQIDKTLDRIDNKLEAVRDLLQQERNR